MVTNGNNHTTLGERLKAARERRGWSQRQLSEAAEISHASVSKIESGKVPNPGADTIQRLALALRIPVSDLVTDKPAPTLEERIAETFRRHPQLRGAFVTDKAEPEAVEFLVRAIETLDAQT